MRSDLDHLPANKQRELERVVQIVFEEFEDALAMASHEWKKKGRILKVILYGSYARNGWVDEPHTAKGYATRQICRVHEVWRADAGHRCEQDTPPALAAL